MIGYNVSPKDHIDSKHFCTACKLLLRDPKQTDCGHRYCSACIDRLLSHANPVCLDPNCSENLSSASIYPDRVAEKEIKRLNLFCNFSEFGCKWSGNFEKFRDHTSQCPYRRSASCPHCNIVLPSDADISLHMDICPRAPVSCPYGCAGTFERKNLEEHETRAATTHLAYLRQRIQELAVLISRAFSSVETSRTDDKRLMHLYSQLCTQLEQHVNAIQSLEWQQRALDVSLEETKLKLTDLENISHDGVLVWRISNVSARINDARSGRQTSIYSPPMYSAPHIGYKMRARIYLNGDGVGRGTHVSMFFLLMRGEYDALLQWPFRQKVTFLLLDQSDAQENIQDSFRPDPRSNSFLRPCTEMNIASGIPRFCPISELEKTNKYVKDNVLFVKIVVSPLDLVN